MTPTPRPRLRFASGNHPVWTVYDGRPSWTLDDILPFETFEEAVAHEGGRKGLEWPETGNPDLRRAWETGRDKRSSDALLRLGGARSEYGEANDELCDLFQNLVVVPPEGTTPGF